MSDDAPTPLAEERRTDHVTRAIRDIQPSLKVGDKRMDAQDKAIAENTKVTLEIKESTDNIVDAFKSLTGAFKVLGWIGNLAKPLGYIIMMGTALVGLWHAIKPAAGVK